MPLPAFGFPAQPRQDMMNRLIGDLRRKSDTVRVEAVTGRLSDPAAANSGRISELLGIDREMTNLDQYGQILDMAESRASTIQSSLDSLRKLAVDLNANSTTALSGTGTATAAPISAEARQALTAAVSALNVSFGGRGLFSGDAGGAALTDADSILAAARSVVNASPDATTAYADLTIEFTQPGGAFDTSMYTGSGTDAPASEIAEGERVAFAPRADAAPLRTLLRDVAALALAYDPGATLADDQRHALAEKAVAGLRNGIDELAGMQGQVGVAEERMATVRAQHDASSAALTRSYNALAARDQYEAAAQLTQLESQLETTYLATARLANLSLANFLR